MVMMRVKTTIMMRMMRMMIRMMSGYDNDEDVGCFPRSMIAGLPQHNLRDGSVHVNRSCTHLNQRSMGAIPVRALALHNRKMAQWVTAAKGCCQWSSDALGEDHALPQALCEGARVRINVGWRKANMATLRLLLS